MAHAHVDHVSTLECIERGGVIRSLTRLARVTGLESTDYQVLMEALEEAGVPKVPSGLGTAGFEMLVLVDRAVRITDEDAGTADVILSYEHIMDGKNQELSFNNQPEDPEEEEDEEDEDEDEEDEEEEEGAGSVAEDGIIIGKVRCSVHQKKTNTYLDYDNAEDPSNPPRRTILLEHTYPKGDAHFSNRPYQQTGELEVYAPKMDMQFGGYIETNNPYKVAKSLVGTINQLPWADGKEAEWMCTEVDFEMSRKATTGATARYLFSFEFQHNPLTWDYEVMFIDERNGKPPVGLIDGVGRKVIKYHKRVNYTQVFGAFIEGWQEMQ